MRLIVHCLLLTLLAKKVVLGRLINCYSEPEIMDGVVYLTEGQNLFVNCDVDTSSTDHIGQNPNW